MKTINRLLFFIISALFFSTTALAKDNNTKTQGSPPIPVEVFFGNNRFVSQITMIKKFSESMKFGFIASSYIAADYENDLSLKQNESMNILLLSYDLYKGLGIVSGAALNSKWGFRPFSGGLYKYANRTFMTMVSSGFYLTESNNFESKAIVQYMPHYKENWSLYTRVEALYTRVEALYSKDMDTKKHERSAIYGRLGLNYNTIAFGLATNYDWYGPLEISRDNYGVFISYAFK